MSHLLKSLCVGSSVLALLFLPSMVSARGADLRAGGSVNVGPVEADAGVNVGTSGVGVGVGGRPDGYYEREGQQGDYYGRDVRYNQGYYVQDGWRKDDRVQGGYVQGGYAADPGYYGTDYPANVQYQDNAPNAYPYGQYYYEQDRRDNRRDGAGAGVYFNVK